MSKVDPKVAELIATPEGRRMLSAVSPSFFDSYYLGLEQAPHRVNWLNTIEDLQKEGKKSNNKKKLLVLSARGHRQVTAFNLICSQATLFKSKCLNFIYQFHLRSS